MKKQRFHMQTPIINTLKIVTGVLSIFNSFWLYLMLGGKFQQTPVTSFKYSDIPLAKKNSDF